MVKNRENPDYVLFLLSVLLITLGVLILSSVSASLSQEKFGNPYYFLRHQIIWGFLPGMILAILFFKIRLETLKKWAPFLFMANLFLSAMVFLPIIGLKLGGANRWISFSSIVFQPSEFLKITSIFYLASLLSSRFEQRKGKIKSRKELLRTLFVFLFIIGLIGLVLILQPDMSTLGIIVLTGFLMYFLTQAPFWHSFLMMLTATLLFYPLIKIAPYRLSRWLIFLNPELDPLGKGYQLKQALIAVGSGGIFGLGLGMSRQKFGFLPHSISDSVFAVFSEETGFLGAVMLILLFVLFFWRSIKISKETGDNFSALLSFGIGFWIVLQAFINIGAMIGILPLAGIPLPFISYGGSHLITELIGVGILLNISRKNIKF